MMTSETRTAGAEHLIVDILRAARIERILYAITALGIPDLLAAGPLDAAALAEASGTRPPLLYRALRLLVAAGVLEEDEDRRFSLTPSGALLRAGVPGSLRAQVIHRGQTWKLRPWEELQMMLRTGETAFDRAMGSPFFDYLTKHPEAGEGFDAAMTGLTVRLTAAVIDAYDFSDAGLIVDVGGGEGELLAAILRANPDACGILFDMPQVVERAAVRLAEAGVSDRCTVAGGDFFRAVPQGGDVYLMKTILHAWPDERATAILDSCRRATGSAGRLLLIEPILRERPPYGLEPVLLDMTMMVELNGKERTETEWRALLADGGFRLECVIPLAGERFIIEALPS